MEPLAAIDGRNCITVDAAGWQFLPLGIFRLLGESDQHPVEWIGMMCGERHTLLSVPERHGQFTKLARLYH
jgi:hypothetical protein